MIEFYAVGLCVFFESSSSSKCSWSYCVVIPNRKARAATKSRKAADTPTTTTRASRRKVVVNGSYERPGRTNINAMQWFKTTFLLQCSSLPRPTSTPRHPPPPPCFAAGGAATYITRAIVKIGAVWKELSNRVVVIKTIYLYAFWHSSQAQAIQACSNIDSHCGMPSFAAALYSRT